MRLSDCQRFSIYQSDSKFQDSVNDFGSNLGWFVIHNVLNLNHTIPTEKFLSVSECLPVRLKTYHLDSFKLELSYCCLTIFCKIMPEIVEFP